MNIKKIFGKLHGVWKFQRSLTGKANFPLGVVRGEAVFNNIEVSNDLAYNENGEFTIISGNTLKISREYLYSYLEKQNKIEKYFSIDGKSTGFMYELKFGSVSEAQRIFAAGDHLCGKDSYRATYQFEGGENFNKFFLTYHVTGPDKSYVSETIYERISC